MYNYNFKENGESLIKEEVGINVKIATSYYHVNFILTENNLLIFYDSNRDNILKGRGVHLLPQYDLLYKLPLNKLKYEIQSDNLILLIDDIRINCYDFDIENFIN